MNSRRLSGRQPAMLNLIQVNAGEHGKSVTEFQADENPVFQCGAQFVFALAQ